MLCDTCQRQPHCLTHQMADQDQKLHMMLERLQQCQQRQSIHQQSRPLPKHYLQRLVRLMEKLARKMVP